MRSMALVYLCILIQECLLLEEINTTMFLIGEKVELVAISHFSLIVCCYHQPPSMDVTLLASLDILLDT